MARGPLILSGVDIHVPRPGQPVQRQGECCGLGVAQQQLLPSRDAGPPGARRAHAGQRMGRQDGPQAGFGSPHLTNIGQRY